MKTFFAFALLISALLCGGCAMHHGDHKHGMDKDDCDCCKEAPMGTTMPSK